MIPFRGDVSPFFPGQSGRTSMFSQDHVSLLHLHGILHESSTICHHSLSDEK